MVVGVFSKEKEKHALMAIIVEMLSFLEQSFPKMEKKIHFPCPFCSFGEEGGGHGFSRWEILEGLGRGREWEKGEKGEAESFFSSSPLSSSPSKICPLSITSTASNSSLSLSSPLSSPSSPFFPSSPLSFPPPPCYLCCEDHYFSGAEIAPEMLFDFVKQLPNKDIERQEIIGLLLLFLF